MFDATELEEIEERFTRALSLSKGELRLLRVGQNALFLVERLGVVVRVYRGSDMEPHAQTEVEFGSLLFRSGIPTVRVCSADRAPIVKAGRYLASLWEWLEPDGVKPTTLQLGQLMKEIHSVGHNVDALGTQLPKFDPIKSAESRMVALKQRNALSAKHLGLLEAHLNKSRRLWEAFESTCDWQIVHGDAHTGNIIVSGGVAHICDFDSVSVGPVEVDAVPVAVISKRFLPDKVGLVDAFHEGYGSSREFKEKAEGLIPVRELTMTTWLAQDAVPGTERFTELLNRIESLNEEDEFTRWYPK